MSSEDLVKTMGQYFQLKKAVPKKRIARTLPVTPSPAVTRSRTRAEREQEEAADKWFEDVEEFIIPKKK
jgi:hypothetical protein